MSLAAEQRMCACVCLRFCLSPIAIFIFINSFRPQKTHKIFIRHRGKIYLVEIHFNRFGRELVHVRRTVCSGARENVFGANIDWNEWKLDRETKQMKIKMELPPKQQQK